MVVQHNLTAMNANRNLSTVTKAQASSTEKLSSGIELTEPQMMQQVFQFQRN